MKPAIFNTEIIIRLENENLALLERIAELEVQLSLWDGYSTTLEATKTCDGCKWLDYPNSRHIGGCSKINLCVRLPMNMDYYEPKGKL